MEEVFNEALQLNDLKRVRSIPKSDLHNHAMMGARLRTMEKFYGSKLQPFSYGKEGILGINRWIGTVYRPVFSKPGVFEAAIKGAFEQAVRDGVTILEMSIDATLGVMMDFRPQEVVDKVKEIHKQVAPHIHYRPELGLNRSHSVRAILSVLEPYLELNYFTAIDLYDNESAQPIENFKEIYRFAKKLGLKCKAHAGEFGDAESVRRSVEIMELDAVQHGIGAASSVEVMKWLSDRGVQLNVCPASNIALKRVRSYSTHPIRILFDHGVKVTINTDDVMLFNAGNSEQFMRLHKSGLFSANELDQIRLNGLR